MGYHIVGPCASKYVFLFQEGSGSDLALLMVECLKTAKRPVDKDTLDKIRSIFDLFEPGSLDRYEFVKSAIL